MDFACQSFLLKRLQTTKPLSVISMTSSPPRRRSLRYRLRAMLVVLMAFGVWLGVQVNQVECQNLSCRYPSPRCFAIGQVAQSENTRPCRKPSQRSFAIGECFQPGSPPHLEHSGYRESHRRAPKGVARLHDSVDVVPLLTLGSCSVECSSFRFVQPAVAVFVVSLQNALRHGALRIA